MEELLSQVELFRGLDRAEAERVLKIGRRRSLGAGQYLFLLGDNAEELYVVMKGSLDLCLPIALRDSVKDITVETLGAGRTLGWSALVKPYRFTLSARASEPTDVVGFARNDLQQLFDAAPRIGNCVLTRVSELVGIRLLTFQALWMRELHRTVGSAAQDATGGQA